MKRAEQLPRSSTVFAWICVALGSLFSGGAMGQAQKSTSYIISGKVLGVNGAAVQDARLTATADRPCSAAAGNDEEGKADASGHFQLRVPCPGVWRLSAEAQGYPRQMYEQHGAFSTGIVLNAAHPDHEIVFTVVGSSSVTGLVLDEIGDPVREAKVYLLTTTAVDDSLRPIDQTTTDDRGMYEFADVAAGGYRVAVQAQPWYAAAAQARGGGPTAQSASQDPSLDLTYPITFYPGSTDAASAATVALAAGARQQADIHLSPVPSVHILIPGGGRPVISFGGGRQSSRSSGVAPQIQQLSDFGALQFNPTSVRAIGDGTLDIAGFAPGDYALASARGHDEGAQQYFTVAKDAGRVIALDGPTAPLEPKSPTTGALVGTVVMAEKPSGGELLLLVPIAAGRVQRQQSNSDGSFSFDKVPLGRYILLAVDQGWSLDLRDRETLSPYLTHGLPIDFEGSLILRKPLEAQSR